MKSKSLLAAVVCSWILSNPAAPFTPVNAAPVRGWLNWRGPEQNGTSREKGLPDKLAVEQALWTADFPGASTPVIANGKLYVMGYLGDGPQLQEGVACFDAETGQKLWQQLFSDFLSDIIYKRYATSSPTVDPETGNVYSQGTQGILAAFTPDGKLLWQHSMMEEYGRLTFPNGRTASPVIDRDLVITRGITANWGAHGPGGDRFYAFDKKTGELVWSSSPGDRPKDNSYSLPYLAFLEGKRVLIATAGDGSVVCVNARTGDPIWRVPLGKAGINATVLVHNNEKVVAIYGTPYEPGQMVAFRIPKVAPSSPTNAPVVVERSQVEIWSQDISTSTSSPILTGDRIYVVAEKGDLIALDVNRGKILWTLKIGIEQRNSCPLYADGKLYVPMLDDPSAKTETGNEGGSEAGTKGALYVIRPSETQGEILSHLSLDGRCFGTPTAYNGKVYLQTTKKIYCFGKKGNNPGLPPDLAAEKWPTPGPAAQLQVIPSEVLLRPGQTASFRIRSLDASGFPVEEIKDVRNVKWASYIPPTARVRSTLKGSFNAEGKLVAATDAVPSAGAFEAVLGNLKGYIRGRVLPYLPIKQDFETFVLSETTTNTVEEPTPFSYPPLPWIGARFKFEVRDSQGTKALTKTIDNKFFQRATVFIGAAEAKNYTIQADVMSEGRMRGERVLKMSEVGLINQRYLILLQGNAQKLQVTSNEERLCVPAKDAPSNFRWQPNVWYILKTRVDVAADGSGVVRAKAWKRGDPEPEPWTLEAPHAHAHRSGSPGLFGFSPQDMRVYIDNVSVTPN
ncbi:MAG: PQQ-binding-like beta-propeller repeat protein [Verrucomicrobia bacterium]|nr:PQQ-binding-like beta-propeller repeat protein [Verrucomicrobiota bacterium]